MSKLRIFCLALLVIFSQSVQSAFSYDRDNVIIYPSTATDYFSIHIADPSPASVSIFTMFGQEVYAVDYIESYYMVNTDFLVGPGIYFVMVVQGNIRETHRLIVL